MGFGPGFLASWLSPPSWPVLGAAFILLVSHFIIDTYIPVMLWAKYLRRAPQFKDVVAAGEVKLVPTAAKPWSDKVIDRVTYLSDVEAFKASFATPVGAILYITMDQFLHVAFLLPVALLMAAQ